MSYKTPSFLKALLTPNGKPPTGRRIWSIDLETVWLPFFVATNAMAETNIPHDALGAPLRLALSGDGSIKFSKSGRPVTKVAKDLSDAVRLARENFAAGLQNHAKQVLASYPDAYREQVELAKEAGAPIIAKDKAMLDDYIALAMEQALADAEAKAKPEAVEVTA